MDARITYDNLISQNQFAVGTSPIQVSGGFTVLSSVAATFIPYRGRARVKIFNTSQGGQTLFVGYTSSVASTGYFISEIPPNGVMDEPANGTVPLWIVATAAGGQAYMAELQ